MSLMCIDLYETDGLLLFRSKSIIFQTIDLERVIKKAENIFNFYLDFNWEEPIEHRFCKKGDKYFCPTLEFLFGFDMVRCVDFTAIRVYDYQTLVAFAMETQHLFGEPHLHSSISGLSYTYVGGEETPIYWGNINDDGVYVSPTSNPFLIVDGLVAKAANHSQYA